MAEEMVGEHPVHLRGVGGDDRQVNRLGVRLGPVVERGPGLGGRGQQRGARRLRAGAVSSGGAGRARSRARSRRRCRAPRWPRRGVRSRSDCPAGRLRPAVLGHSTTGPRADGRRVPTAGKQPGGGQGGEGGPQLSLTDAGLLGPLPDLVESVFAVEQGEEGAVPVTPQHERILGFQPDLPFFGRAPQDRGMGGQLGIARHRVGGCWVACRPVLTARLEVNPARRGYPQNSTPSRWAKTRTGMVDRPSLSRTAPATRSGWPEKIRPCRECG